MAGEWGKSHWSIVNLHGDLEGSRSVSSASSESEDVSATVVRDENVPRTSSIVRPQSSNSESHQSVQDSEVYYMLRLPDIQNETSDSDSDDFIRLDDESTENLSDSESHLEYFTDSTRADSRDVRPNVEQGSYVTSIDKQQIDIEESYRDHDPVVGDGLVKINLEIADGTPSNLLHAVPAAGEDVVSASRSGIHEGSKLNINADDVGINQEEDDGVSAQRRSLEELGNMKLNVFPPIVTPLQSAEVVDRNMNCTYHTERNSSRDLQRSTSNFCDPSLGAGSSVRFTEKVRPEHSTVDEPAALYVPPGAVSVSSHQFRSPDESTADEPVAPCVLPKAVPISSHQSRSPDELTPDDPTTDERVAVVPAGASSFSYHHSHVPSLLSFLYTPRNLCVFLLGGILLLGLSITAFSLSAAREDSLHTIALETLKDDLQNYKLEYEKCRHNFRSHETDRITMLQAEILRLKQEANTLRTEVSKLQLDSVKRRYLPQNQVSREAYMKLQNEANDLKHEVVRLKYTEHPANRKGSLLTNQQLPLSSCRDAPSEHRRDESLVDVQKKLETAERWSEVWKARYTAEHMHRVQLERNLSSSLITCLDILNTTVLNLLPSIDTTKLYNLLVNFSSKIDFTNFSNVTYYIGSPWEALKTATNSAKPIMVEYMDNLWNFASLVLSDYMKGLNGEERLFGTPHGKDIADTGGSGKTAPDDLYGTPMRDTMYASTEEKMKQWATDENSEAKTKRLRVPEYTEGSINTRATTEGHTKQRKTDKQETLSEEHEETYTQPNSKHGSGKFSYRRLKRNVKRVWDKTKHKIKSTWRKTKTVLRNHDFAFSDVKRNIVNVARNFILWGTAPWCESNVSPKETHDTAPLSSNEGMNMFHEESDDRAFTQQARTPFHESDALRYKRENSDDNINNDYDILQYCKRLDDHSEGTCDARRDNAENSYNEGKEYIRKANDYNLKNDGSWYFAKSNEPKYERDGSWYFKKSNDDNLHDGSWYFKKSNGDNLEHDGSWYFRKSNGDNLERDGSTYLKKSNGDNLEHDGSWYFKKSSSDNLVHDGSWYFRKSKDDNLEHNSSWYFRKSNGDNSERDGSWYFKKSNGDNYEHDGSWYFKKSSDDNLEHDGSC